MMQTRGLNVFLPQVLAAGFVQASIIEKGKVIREWPVQKNLILDNGLDLLNNGSTGRYWEQMMRVCVAGTGSTPTRDLVDGTASQAGTTVTLAGSSYSFTSGDVGKWIKWATGEECKITAQTSATTVTVDRSQTVASAALTGLFRANQTGLANEVVRTGTTAANAGSHYPVFTATDGNPSQGVVGNSGTETVNLRRTFDFPEETSPQNYTEIGLSYTTTVGNNLFSRILLAGAVSVGVGQQLRIQYNLQLKLHNIASQPEVTWTIPGWPVQYNIASITSNGSKWVITTSAAHHYAVGGKFSIVGAARPKTAITAASSSGADFTITAPGHGRSGGDSITIEGMTPPGYNGTFTVDSVAGDDITVLSTANPGTGTVMGTVRQANGSPWYDGGEYTIAAVPTSTSLEVTTTDDPGNAGASGYILNNTKAAIKVLNWGIRGIMSDGSPRTSTDTTNGFFQDTVNACDGLFEPVSTAWALGYTDGVKSFPSFPTMTSTFTSTARADSTSAKYTYVAGSFYQQFAVTFVAGVMNAGNIRTFYFGGRSGAGAALSSTAYPSIQMNFSERQLKDSLHKLEFTVTRFFGRVLG